MCRIRALYPPRLQLGDILLSDTEQADHVYETKVKCQDNAFGQLGSNKRMLIGCNFFSTP